jgi:hypothetical protein
MLFCSSLFVRADGFRKAFRSMKINLEIASKIAIRVVSVTDAYFCGKGVKHNFPVTNVGIETVKQQREQ